MCHSFLSVYFLSAEPFLLSTSLTLSSCHVICLHLLVLTNQTLLLFFFMIIAVRTLCWTVDMQKPETTQLRVRRELVYCRSFPVSSVYNGGGFMMTHSVLIRSHECAGNTWHRVWNAQRCGAVCGNGLGFMHLLWVLRLHPARQGMWIYKPAQPCRCGTKEQVLWCIPWCVSPSSPRPRPPPPGLAPIPHHHSSFPSMPCTSPVLPPSVAGAAASLLGLACLSLPKQPWLMKPWTHPLFPLDLGSPTAE